MTAQLSPAELAAIRSAGVYTHELVKWRSAWIEQARSKQLPPQGPWLIWNILAGRGFGKTRTGAEDAGWYAASAAKPVRVAVVAPTQGDCRSVCFEGESGLLSVIPPFFIRKFNRADLELHLKNGSLIAGKSAEKPDRLRGPQFHRAWCDELASWGASAGVSRGKDEAVRLKATWDNLMFGLRLGSDPRVVITTTPRPIQFLRDLLKNPRCHNTRGSTFENESNLAGTAIEMFRDVYSGTRRGQQELYAEILDTNENALWKPAQLEACRVDDIPEGVTLTRIVVAIDPAVTSDEEESDETGIVTAAMGSDGLIYVLDDLSGIMTPAEWATVALLTYERRDADCIVGEKNQGGDLVESNLRSQAVRAHDERGDVFFRYKGVHAKRGKYLRAEPVAAYYERGKVRHVGYFPKLESQMCNFTGSTASGSPDRLDALVYAVGELMLGNHSHAFW